MGDLTCRVSVLEGMLPRFSKSARRPVTSVGIEENAPPSSKRSQVVFNSDTGESFVDDPGSPLSLEEGGAPLT